MFKPAFLVGIFNENVHVWSYNIKIIVYSRVSPQNKSTFFLVEYTWHILESNVTLQKIGFENYLNFEKFPWNQLLQCKISELMHNNEKLSCYLSFN
jgi:hypothetical protein